MEMKAYNKIFKIVNEVTGDIGLNVLINNAGTSTKFTRIGLVKQEQLTESFFINTVAPIMLTKVCNNNQLETAFDEWKWFLRLFIFKVLHPLLKKAANNYPNRNEMTIKRAAVINMSSILGSVEKNDQGGFYPYRCSKVSTLFYEKHYQWPDS